MQQKLGAHVIFIQIMCKLNVSKSNEKLKHLSTLIEPFAQFKLISDNAGWILKVQYVSSCIIFILVPCCEWVSMNKKK